MKNAFKYGAVTLGLLLGLGSPAHAASSWVFTGSSTADGLGDGGVLANTSYGTNGVASLTISGAFATNGASNTGYASGATWNTSTKTAGSDAAVNYYSGNGLAMCSDSSAQGCSAPVHALDDSLTTEAVLLNFSSKVDLTSLGIGYVSSSSGSGANATSTANVSVFQYTGTTAPSLTGVGASLSAMIAAGWSLVGNYADLAQNDTTYNLVNGATTSGTYGTTSASSVGSSWWLVTAYNTSYGSSGIDEASGATVSMTADEGNSYFKIYGVAGSAATCTTNCGGTKVPEPASLALVGLALFGVAATRRQIRKS